MYASRRIRKVADIQTYVEAMGDVTQSKVGVLRSVMPIATTRARHTVTAIGSVELVSLSPAPIALVLVGARKRENANYSKENVLKERISSIFVVTENSKDECGDYRGCTNTVRVQGWSSECIRMCTQWRRVV